MVRTPAGIASVIAGLYPSKPKGASLMPSSEPEDPSADDTRSNRKGDRRARQDIAKTTTESDGTRSQHGTRPQIPEKWCDTHQSKHHSNAQCRTPDKQLLARLKVSVDQPNIAPTQGSLPRIILRCYNCNEAGHTAPHCHKPKASAAQTQHSVESIPTSTTATEPERSYEITSIADYERVFGAPTQHGQENQGVDLSTAIFVPVVIGAISTKGYVDTGCARSAISLDIFMRHGGRNNPTYLKPEDGSLFSLLEKGTFTPQRRSIELPLQFGDKSIIHRWDATNPPDGIDVIVGRDLLQRSASGYLGCHFPKKHQGLLP